MRHTIITVVVMMIICNKLLEICSTICHCDLIGQVLKHILF